MGAALLAVALLVVGCTVAIAAANVTTVVIAVIQTWLDVVLGAVSLIIRYILSPLYSLFTFAIKLCLMPLVLASFTFQFTYSAIHDFLNWCDGLLLIWTKGLVIKNGLILNKKMTHNDRYQTIKYLFPFQGKDLTLIQGYIRRVQMDGNTTIPIDIINMIFTYYNYKEEIKGCLPEHTIIYKALNNRFNFCEVGSQIDILCDPSDPGTYAIPIRSFAYHNNKTIQAFVQRLYIVSVLLDKSVGYIMRWIIDTMPCGVFITIAISTICWPISLYMIGLRNIYDLKSNTWSS